VRIELILAAAGLGVRLSSLAVVNAGVQGEVRALVVEIVTDTFDGVPAADDQHRDGEACKEGQRRFYAHPPPPCPPSLTPLPPPAPPPWPPPPPPPPAPPPPAPPPPPPPSLPPPPPMPPIPLELPVGQGKVSMQLHELQVQTFFPGASPSNGLAASWISR